MSSQRPKKIKAGRGSITLPPELAAHYLRSAVQNASSSTNNNSDDAEMKALMSMFVEIMGMDGTTTASAEGGGGGATKEMSFSFSSGSSTSTSAQWPPSAAAAAAAVAASGMFSSDGQWSFDYYNDDDDDDDDETDDHVKPTAEHIAADAMARQIALDEQVAEDERTKKAAKRREKKQRKKTKAKQEALLKSQEADQKKRSKQIQSWRSRVVAACQSKEDYKIQGLLAESPLGKQQEDDVNVHLEFFLPHCFATSLRNDVGDQANQKLAAFVVATNASVVYSLGKNGRSALHTACLMGDCYFVKMATDKCEEDSPLDLWCKDAGWTPLHYAVAAANVEAVEDLLMLECELDSLTDESLTCRASTGEGITARELADILALGKQDQEIETQGNALEEAIQLYASNKADKKRYLRIMKTIASRLKQVEENGYEPPDWIFENNHDGEVEKEETKERSSSISEEGKSKRKKKKKKQVKKEQQPEPTVASRISPEPVVSTPVEKKVDPLVTALLGMGFDEAQIFAAAKACGGLERATADQMVMWILSGGEESPSSPTATTDAATEKSEPAFIPTSRTGSNAKSAPTKAKKPAAQPAAKLKVAQKENMEAVKREEAARLHAEQLAAKREEQRRRNREWNNRAQARQQEEIELRAQEEAKRIAKERAAAQRQAAAGPMLAAKASKHAHASARTTQAPAPTQILQRPSHMPVGGIAAGIVPRPYPAVSQTADPNMMRYSSHGYAEYDGNSVSSAGSGRHVSAQYVSSANSVSSAGSGMPIMVNQYVSSGNSVSSGGSGMHNAGMMQYQSQQPMYGYPLSSVPPPGFRPFGGTPSASGGSMSLSEEAAVGYEDSTTGEIRATARTFVPTAFKPAPIVSTSSDITTSAPMSSLPAGTNMASSLQPSQSSLSDEDALASLLSAAPGNAPPVLAPIVTPTQSSSTADTEDQALKSVVGFDLNGSTDRSSLLGSLSLASANDGAEDAGSSIWGGSSLAPCPASLPGFGVPGFQQASSTAGEPVGDEGAGLWNTSSLNQRGTSRLSGIW